MYLILQTKKAKMFLEEMDVLEAKFAGYLDGNLCDFVKLNVKNGKVVLEVDDTVPQFINVACNMAFVNTLL